MEYPEAGFNTTGYYEVDFVLSTDSIKKCKPDGVAYQLGVEVFNLKKEENLFLHLVAGIIQVENILTIQLYG